MMPQPNIDIFEVLRFMFADLHTVIFGIGAFVLAVFVFGLMSPQGRRAALIVLGGMFGAIGLAGLLGGLFGGRGKR